MTSRQVHLCRSELRLAKFPYHRVADRRLETLKQARHSASIAKKDKQTYE